MSMHIVSNVQGKLKDGEDMVSALAAGFPRARTSGAPKIRAMQIITELEPHARGVDAGAVGRFRAGGDMDTCIGAAHCRCSLAARSTCRPAAGSRVDFNPEASSWRRCTRQARCFRAAEESARYDRGNR